MLDNSRGAIRSLSEKTGEVVLASTKTLVGDLPLACFVRKGWAYAATSGTTGFHAKDFAPIIFPR